MAYMPISDIQYRVYVVIINVKWVKFKWKDVL